MGDAGETQSVAKWSAFHDFARKLVVARKFCADGKVGAVLHQELCHRKSRVMKLRDSVKDRRLPADAGFIQRR